ncbi:efflux transporter outer membrane subunit (plasmid) [Aliirhizobium terrae]|uniref:efflux transporter outer membrane subunit n=1 Tax=Terrirhizobium terrae TaxID=2926709 RepID=UPI002574F271|nr:efflux transporter outer membrane subunit [Rhizobium sp. CC-CFT758]WJH38669.1 efflux transporter outer membrane subunit [Rhizobium sp. CC-CFT758]
MRLEPRKRAIVAVLSLTMLSGCVVGPDYQTPGSVLPASWSSRQGKEAEKPAQLSHWWRNLNDPLLNSYVDRAMGANLRVQAAMARVTEARAQLRQDEGGLLPTLGSSSSVQRSKVAEQSAAVGDNPATQWRSGFDAGWEIDLFGGRRRSVEAARYGLDASQEDLRNTMLVLIGDVASNYVQVRGSQAQLALARRTGRSQRDTAALTRAKADAGTATVAEVARSEALAASTEAQIPAIEINRSAAIHRLGVLLGLPPASLALELEKSRPIPRPKLPMPVGIPADSILARPDVRMAERQLAQSTARIGVAEAARYPSLSLTGNIASQALSLGDLAEKSTMSWAIGPALTIPLFRGGQLKTAVEVSRARRDASAAAYQTAVLTAMEDVENAIVSLNQNRIRGAKLTQAVSSYWTAYQASRVQYESGTLDYLNLLDTQRAQYDAEASLIDSQIALTKAYISLNKALGGGWSGQRAGVKVASNEASPATIEASR